MRTIRCSSSTNPLASSCIRAQGTPRARCRTRSCTLTPRLAQTPRAGIVHRLDKDTTGLMVVARTLEAHTALVRAIEAREVERDYEAICLGVMTGGGLVDAPIGRHSVDRLRMSIREDGRDAVTHYRVVQRFRGHTHVSLKLETGRTHQIRVHMAHIKYPLVGDKVYGGRLLAAERREPRARRSAPRLPPTGVARRAPCFRAPDIGQTDRVPGADAGGYAGPARGAR